VTTDHYDPMSDELDRDAIAARIGFRPDDHLPGMAPAAESLLREHHARAAESLASARAERDALNARIKELVADEELLARAVAVFDRAHRNDDAV
jgi:hypothetical protein